MKKVIYYFSGTGNSLEFATKLAARLDAKAVGTASLREGPAGDKDEAAGLVFPVYMYRAPTEKSRLPCSRPASTRGSGTLWATE